MKNNKGYYSWIHSMKNAAMESHFKGKQMINEATETERITKETMKRAGGDFDTYQEILRAKQEAAARELPKERTVDDLGSQGPSRGPIAADAYAMARSGMGSNNLEPVDVDGDGDADAKDVEADGRDWKMNHTGIERKPFSKAARLSAEQPAKYGEGKNLRQRLQDLATALDMRERGQHEELSQYHKGLLGLHDTAIRDLEKNRKADMSAEHAEEMLGAGHGPLGLRFESVSQKISRLLNG